MDSNADVPQSPVSKFHVCAPAASRTTFDDGQIWLVVGPVTSCTNVLPGQFTFFVRVRAASRFTGREVFARAVPKLVAQRHLKSSVEAHETLRLLARDPCPSSATNGQHEPSWRDLSFAGHLSVTECRRVLRRAQDAVSSSSDNRDGGSVTLVRVDDVSQHPWVKYSLHCRDLRISNAAVEKFRAAHSFLAMTPDKQRTLVGSANAATMQRMRAVVELEPRGELSVNAADTSGVTAAGVASAAGAATSGVAPGVAVGAGTSGVAAGAGTSGVAPEVSAGAGTFGVAAAGVSSAVDASAGVSGVGAAGVASGVHAGAGTSGFDGDGAMLGAPGDAESSIAAADVDNPETVADASRVLLPRARRRQMPSGKSACKIFPSQKLAARVRREAVDSPNRPSHSMITLSNEGSIRVWRYVVGSASKGVRHYRLADGTTKRLAAPYLRRVADSTPVGAPDATTELATQATDHDGTLLQGSRPFRGAPAGLAGHQLQHGSGQAMGDSHPRVSGAHVACGDGGGDGVLRLSPDVAPGLGGGSNLLCAATAAPPAQHLPPCTSGTLMSSVNADVLAERGRRELMDCGSASAFPPRCVSPDVNAGGAADVLPADDRGTRYDDDDIGCKNNDDLRQLQAAFTEADDAAESGVEEVITSLGDIAHAPLEADVTKKRTHRVTKTTYLKKDDGSDREVVVAVEFDAVESLALTLRAGANAHTKHLSGVTVSVTLAGDGGPVRRTTLTVFTLTISAPIFPTGMSPLVPVLFLLSGEQAIHSAVGSRLREQLKAALSASYAVPLVQSGKGGAVERPAEDGGEEKTSTAEFNLPYFLRLCGDFAMLCHLLSLTGGSDQSRCPSWWLCVPHKYLSAAFWLSTPPGGPRLPNTLSQHWLLVVWSLARWCATLRGHWQGAGGQVSSTCSCGATLVAHSNSPAVLRCGNRSCSTYGTQSVHLLPPIAYSPLSDMHRLLRRLLGGTRGFPVLGDIPFVVQPPVLHCTGKISKNLIWFLFSRLTASQKIKARRDVFSLLGRGNMQSMYLREFGLLVAHVVADPDVLGVPLDGGIIMMMQLSQLLIACWRRAIGTSTPLERECAAVTLQLAAAMLSTLYAVLKPFDTGTKSAGVYNLYLHTAMAHVRSTVGAAFPTAKHMCDDNIEGLIALLNKYFRTKVNNVSRGEALVNKEAMSSLTINKEEGHHTAEKRIFTEELIVCSCVYHLSPSVLDDTAAVAAWAKNEPMLSVRGDPPQLLALASPKTLSFALPASILDEPRANPDPLYEPGADVHLQAELQAAQRRLVVCWCGKMTGRRPSSLCIQATEASRAAKAEQLAGKTKTANERVPVEATPPSARVASQGSAAPAATAASIGSRAGARDVMADEEEECNVDGPVEGERTYNLIDDMDDASDAEQDCDGDCGDSTQPLSPTHDHPGRFLLQCAAQDDRVSSFLPSSALVDAVFSPEDELSDARRSGFLAVRHEMQQDCMMLRMFAARLNTPVFMEWMERDGVLRQDLLRACETLESAMVRRVAATEEYGVSV